MPLYGTGGTGAGGGGSGYLAPGASIRKRLDAGRQDREGESPEDKLAREIGRLHGMAKGGDRDAQRRYERWLHDYGRQLGWKLLDKFSVPKDDYVKHTGDRSVVGKSWKDKALGALGQTIHLASGPQQRILQTIQRINRGKDQVVGKLFFGEPDENFRGQGSTNFFSSLTGLGDDTFKAGGPAFLNPFSRAGLDDEDIGFHNAMLQEDPKSGLGKAIEAAGMIATDPLNLVSFGEGTLARTAGKQLAEGGLREVAEAGSRKAVREMLKNPATRAEALRILEEAASTSTRQVPRRILPGTATRVVEHGSLVRPLAGAADLSRGGGILTRMGERVAATVGGRQVRSGGRLYAERALAQFERRFGGGLVLAGRSVPGTGNQAFSRALRAAHIIGWSDKTRLAMNPEVRNGVLKVQQVANSFTEGNFGRPIREVARDSQADEDVIQAAAGAYAAARHAPEDPATQAAYGVFNDVTAGQAEVLRAKGVKFELMDGPGDPYKSVEEMIEDVSRRNRLKVRNTAQDLENFEPGHVMAERIDPALAKRLGLPEETTKNDLFRAVHDMFGHAAIGNDFGRHGEEVAWAMHSQMYPEEALSALATETRGQTAALVAGGEFPRQKMTLMPAEFTRPMEDLADRTPGIRPRAAGEAARPAEEAVSDAEETFQANKAAREAATSGPERQKALEFRLRKVATASPAELEGVVEGYGETVAQIQARLDSLRGELEDARARDPRLAEVMEREIAEQESLLDLNQQVLDAAKARQGGGAAAGAAGQVKYVDVPNAELAAAADATPLEAKGAQGKGVLLPGEHVAKAAPVEGPLPPVPPGHTRVYRGEQDLAQQGGDNFTTELAEAQGHAGTGKVWDLDAEAEGLDEGWGSAFPTGEVPPPEGEAAAVNTPIRPRAAREQAVAEGEAKLGERYDKQVGRHVQRAEKLEQRAQEAEGDLADLQADLSATLDAAPGTPTYGLGEKVGKASQKAHEARAGADRAQEVATQAAKEAEGGDARAVSRAAIAKQAAEQADAAAAKAEEALDGLYERLDAVQSPRTPTGAPQAREGAETAASGQPAAAAAPETPLGRELAGRVTHADEVRALLEDDLNGVADMFDLDTVTDADVASARSILAKRSREWVDANLPETVTVYRGGEARRDVVSVTTQRSTAARHAAMGGKNGKVTEHVIPRDAIEFAADAVPGPWAEGELLVRREALEGAAATPPPPGHSRFFHGTSQPIPNDAPATGASRSADNLYGPGFYVTDDPAVATNYTRKGGRKAVAGGEPVVYEVDVPDNLKFLDVDKALPEEAQGAARRYIDALGESTLLDDVAEEDWQKVVAALDRNTAGSEVWDALRKALDGRPKSQANEVVDGLNDAMHAAGFDGLSHVGGARTGGPPHNVRVIFQPEEATVRRQVGERAAADTSRLDRLKEELKALDASEEGQAATTEAMDRAAELQAAIREEAARLTPEAIDLPAARAAAEALPPPAPGTVRMYRSELPLAGRDRYDPVAGKFVAGGDEQTGRWFSDSLDVAAAENRDVGVFKYVDVPEDVASDRANLFARQSIVGAGSEVTLPEDLAAQARPLGAAAGEAAAPAGRRPVLPRPRDERRPTAGYGMGKRMQRAEQRLRDARKEARDARFRATQAETAWQETGAKLAEDARVAGERASRGTDLAARPRLIDPETMESSTGAKPFFQTVVEKKGLKSRLGATKVGQTVRGVFIPRAPTISAEGLGIRVAEETHDLTSQAAAGAYHQPLRDALERFRYLITKGKIKAHELPDIYKALETPEGIEALRAAGAREPVVQSAIGIRSAMNRMRRSITESGAVDEAALRDADTYMWRQLTEAGQEALGLTGGQQVVERFMRERGLQSTLGQGGALRRRQIMPEAGIAEAEEKIGGALRARGLLEEGQTLYEQNPWTSAALRLSAGYAASAEAHVLTGLSNILDDAGEAIAFTARKTDSPGVLKTMENEARRLGYKEIELSSDANLRAWVHPEVVPEVERLRAVVFNDKAMQNWEKFLDYVTGIWKRGATVPATAGTGFIARNVVGNLFNNFVRGVSNPATYLEALGVQKMVAKIALRSRETGEDFDTAMEALRAEGRIRGTGPITRFQGNADRRFQLIQEARQHGILDEGFYTIDLGEGELRRLATSRAARIKQQVNPLSRESALYQPGSWLNRWAEQNGRMAHFIDKIDKLGNPVDAARSVRETLFDYSDLTAFERTKMKRINAFYTFTRKNLAFQGKAIKESPARVRRPLLVEQAFIGNAERPGDDESGSPFLPSYAIDAGQKPLNGTLARLLTGNKRSAVTGGLDFPIYNAIDTISPLIEMTAIGIEETPLLGRLVPAEGFQPRGGNWSERAAEVARDGLGLTSGTPAEVVRLWYETAGEFDSFTGAPFVDQSGKMNKSKLDRFLAMSEMLSPGITKTLNLGYMATGHGKFKNRDFAAWRVAIARGIIGANITPVDESASSAEAWGTFDRINRELRQKYGDDLPTWQDLVDDGFVKSTRPGARRKGLLFGQSSGGGGGGTGRGRAATGSGLYGT